MSTARLRELGIAPAKYSQAGSHALSNFPRRRGNSKISLTSWVFSGEMDLPGHPSIMDTDHSSSPFPASSTQSSASTPSSRSEEHTSELQSQSNLVCRL